MIDSLIKRLFNKEVKLSSPVEGYGFTGLLPGEEIFYQAPKPKISLNQGVWECVGAKGYVIFPGSVPSHRLFIGLGRTPMKAYSNWELTSEHRPHWPIGRSL